MRFDGREGDMEFACDLLAGVAIGCQSKNFEFTGGQGWFFRCLPASTEFPGKNVLGKGSDDGSAGANLKDGVRNFTKRCCLLKKSPGAVSEGPVDACAVHVGSE